MRKDNRQGNTQVPAQNKIEDSRQEQIGRAIAPARNPKEQLSFTMGADVDVMVSNSPVRSMNTACRGQGRVGEGLVVSRCRAVIRGTRLSDSVSLQGTPEDSRGPQRAPEEDGEGVDETTSG